MSEDTLYDVVAVRSNNNGSTLRAVISGPFEEVDARYHAKRLKEVSPDQDYIVVVHHICAKCVALGDNDNFDEMVHTCTRYYNEAPEV